MERSFTRTILVVLLVIAGVLSYVDRGNLSVAKPEIAGEFRLNDTEMGYLMSAFFWSYALLQIPAGWLADRYDVKKVFAWGYFLWTIATLATGWVSGFAALFFMRLLLGAGESVVYPAVSRILLEHFPENRRGLPNALIAAGTKIGPALSMLLGGLIVAHWGWRELFIMTGIVGLLWLVPWVLFVPSSKTPASGKAASDNSIRFRDLVTNAAFWGTTMGFFCLGYALYFLINWLPSYLEEGRQFSKSTMAIAGSLPFWVMGGSTVIGGMVSDWLITAGVSPTRSRMTTLVVGFGLSAVFILPVPYLESDVLCLVCLAIACAGLGLFSSNSWAVTQTLAGPRAAGKWSGLQNALGNLGGIAASIFPGWLLTKTGRYDLAFVAASVVLVIGIAAYLFLVGSVQPVVWKSDSDNVEAEPTPILES